MHLLSAETIVLTLLTAWALALSSLGSAMGQQSTDSGRSIVTIGCVSQAVPDGSLAGSPGVPPATPASAPTLANSAQPTGALLLSGALPDDASEESRSEAKAGRAPTSRVPAMTYVLDDGPPEISKHIGHWIEVEGRLTVLPTGTGEAKAPVNHLAVKGVRMLKDKCPTAPASQQR
jgi:hypothetical protein